MLSALLSAGSGNLEAIHVIKKTGGTLHESYLDEGYILDKKIGVGQVSVWGTATAPVARDEVYVLDKKIGVGQVSVWGMSPPL